VPRRLPLSLLGLALALSACAGAPASPGEDGVLRIVAATDVYGDIAASIAGDAAEVTSIISGTADPHQYQANGRVQLALSRADIVILNGGGYDDFADRMLAASRNDAVIVLTAVDLAGLDPAADGFNEHVWYHLPAMRALAAQLATAIGDADPALAEEAARRAEAFAGGLGSLEERIASLRERTAGIGVLITEPVPGYLLDALGMRNLTPPEFSAAIEEDSDVPPTLLQQVLDLLGDGSAQLVVYNAQTGGPQTDAVLDVAGELGIPAIGVSETLPDGVGYLDWQAAHLDAIERAVG